MIDPDYLDYMKQLESKIPNYDYGRDHLKPFYGILFEKDDLCYVSNVNHYKEKHVGMNQSIDFQKIYDLQYGKMIATSSLNYMFPVPREKLVRMDYRCIDDYIDFKDSRARYNRVTLLKKILLALNHSNMQKRAECIYMHKQNHSQSSLSRRCLDFRQLEIAAHEYMQDMDQDITETAKQITEDSTLQQENRSWIRKN